MKESITLTEQEFGQLPFFIRPMAQGGFKKKAGLSISDYKEGLGRLVFLLDEVKTAPDPSQAAARAREALATGWRLAEKLPGLARYFREVPEESARFIKDKATLAEITKVSEEREAWTKELMENYEASKGFN